MKSDTDAYAELLLEVHGRADRRYKIASELRDVAFDSFEPRICEVAASIESSGIGHVHKQDNLAGGECRDLLTMKVVPGVKLPWMAANPGIIIEFRVTGDEVRLELYSLDGSIGSSNMRLQSSVKEFCEERACEFEQAMKAYILRSVADGWRSGLAPGLSSVVKADG